MTPAALARGTAAPLTAGEMPSRAIPFDQSFQFKLDGTGTLKRQTVTVSVEASFTAVSIGYGVVPLVTPVKLAPQPAAPLALAFTARLGRLNVPQRSLNAFSAQLPAAGPVFTTPPPVALRDITLGDLMDSLRTALATSPDVSGNMPPLEAALRNGIKLNAKFASTALLDDGNAILDRALLQKLFQVVSVPAEEVRFLYALFDEASGREFQSEPILNVAGLGGADGRRPFRYFAQPITFMPRATIRMDVTPLGEFQGDLHVALHGYKVLGGAAPPPRERPERRTGR